MDKTTEGLLGEFSVEFGFEKLDEEDRFERFGAFLSTRNHFSETTFNPNGLITGGDGGDTGFDSVAIIANNHLITDIDTIDHLIDLNGYLDVIFVFSQSERTAGFNTQKVGQFGFGVTDFFGAGKLVQNKEVKEKAEIMRKLYSNSSKFPVNPKCFMYYVTTGKWKDDNDLTVRAEAVEGDLKNTNMFSAVEFEFIDADTIRKLYQQTKNQISREFTFANKVTVPNDIDGVKESYLGYMSAQDFLKLICDDNNKIIESLFYENIRDWSGYNDINDEIRTTLQNADKNRFILMNNGVTIIAKVLRVTGDHFYMNEFYVVNGCQTSHVLNDNRDLLTTSVRVPFRLISTREESVIEAVIKATNRQTAVKEDQFFALKDFAKKLETYFKSYDVDKRIFYERRAHQFDAADIAKARIVVHQDLVRAVGAMFLGEPHNTTRTFRALRAKVGVDIFVDDHRFEPYYVAGYSLYRFEQLLKEKKIDRRFTSARYQILFALRWLLDADRFPFMNSKDMAKRCDAMMAVLWDDAKCTEQFVRATEVIDDVGGKDWDRDTIRTDPVTKSILRKVGPKNEKAN